MDKFLQMFKSNYNFFLYIYGIVESFLEKRGLTPAKLQNKCLAMSALNHLSKNPYRSYLAIIPKIQDCGQNFYFGYAYYLKNRFIL